MTLLAYRYEIHYEFPSNPRIFMFSKKVFRTFALEDPTHAHVNLW